MVVHGTIVGVVHGVTVGTIYGVTGLTIHGVIHGLIHEVSVGAIQEEIPEIPDYLGMSLSGVIHGESVLDLDECKTSSSVDMLSNVIT